jgi:hypothetical protein
MARESRAGTPARARRPRLCLARDRRRPLAIGGLALAGLLVAGRAEAEGGMRLLIDWEKLGTLLRRDDAPSPCESPRAMAAHPLPDAPRLELPMLDGLQGGRLSLVAHDWEGARLLMGRLSATDQVGHGRSRRMVLVRARLFDALAGSLSPFVQIGVGQWRIDPDMPVLPHDVVAAAQAGAGVELLLSRWASIAIEVNCTVLDPERADREGRAQVEPQRAGAAWVHPTALWGSFVAGRAIF